MKKLILKTILITFGVSVLLLFALFGAFSFWAPALMMNFTHSLGMNSVSGDYAFREYERSGDISYLARSFEIAVETENNRSACQRFNLLYENEGFTAYCESRNQGASEEGGEVSYSYRDYVCGQGALVKYLVAGSSEEKAAACELAVNETAVSFPDGNPAVVLAVKVAAGKDKETSAVLLAKLSAKEFNTNSQGYAGIIKILEAVE